MKKGNNNMPVLKTPDELKDYERLAVKNFQSDIIIDELSLSAGLDMAIGQMKKGEITLKAREALRDLIAQSYGVFTRRIALNILKEEGCLKENTDLAGVSIRFDTPDDSHDDLYIYYKVS